MSFVGRYRRLHAAPAVAGASLLACLALPLQAAAQGVPASDPSALPLLPPRTPEISRIVAGSLPARVDYVRLTYVTPGGESGPSPELPNGLGAGTLTTIESPAAVPGAVGYNVYAVANNGDTDTGHVLQNDAPIPFGTTYVEPLQGWRTTGKRLTIEGTDTTVEAIPPTGSSVAVPRTPSIGGDILFPRNQASGPAIVSVTTTPASSGRPGSVSFVFDRTVRFDELPSFYLIATKDILPEDPALLELRDATENRPIATLDKDVLGTLTFIGFPWHDGSPVPFVAEAGHRYEAVVVGSPPSMLKIQSLKQFAYVLPPVGGVTGEITIPPVSEGSPNQMMRGSDVPPVGVPALAGPTIVSVPYYAIVTSRDPASFEGQFRATIHLPAPVPSGEHYALAAFDPELFAFGWKLDAVPLTALDSRTLSLSVDLPDTSFYAETYVLALYAERDVAPRASVASPAPAYADSLTATSLPGALPARPTLAVLGDSTALVALVHPSPLHCGVAMEAAPNCQYLFEAGADYAKLAGARSGFNAINLAHIGSQSVQSWTFGRGALAAQVPQIPLDASVVVVTNGLLDCSENQFADETAHVDALTDAIRARVPRAKIVYVGVRYFNETATVPIQRRCVDTWDAREARLAARDGGGFLDLRRVLPPGWTPQTPDGVHFAAAAEETVAERLQAVLAGLRTTAQRRASSSNSEL